MPHWSKAGSRPARHGRSAEPLTKGAGLPKNQPPGLYGRACPHAQRSQITPAGDSGLLHLRRSRTSVHDAILIPKQQLTAVRLHPARSHGLAHGESANDE